MLGLVPRQPDGGLAFYLDFAVLSVGELTSRLVGFFVFAVLARRLTPDGYGAVEYVVGLSVFFATLVECGLGTVGVRRITREPGALSALAAQIPAARLGLAVLAAPLMVLVAAPATQGATAQALVWLFAGSLLAAPWSQTWLLQATERMREAALAQVLRTLVFALVVLALVRGPGDILVVGWAEIAAVAAMSLYCIAIQQARITPWRLRAPGAGLAGLVREGALVGLGNFVWAANHYAPLLLVASLVGGEETAWFAAASRVVGALLSFSGLYYFNLYPAIARGTTGDREALAHTLAASFRVLAWGGTLAAVTLTLLAEPLCVLVFGSAFGPSAPMLVTLAWALPVTLLSGHARWSLIAAGIQSRVVWAQLAGFLTLAVAGAPLVLALGGRGAAVAALLAVVAVWLASHALATRAGARLPAFRIALAPVALAAAVIGAARLLGVHHAVVGLVGAVAFAGAAPLLDRELLRAVARLGAARRERSTWPDRTA